MLSKQINILPIPALKDNYIWAIVDKIQHTVVIVDPGEAEVVFDFLKRNNLSLLAIMVTHHHWDHTNGISQLVQHYQIPVFGPDKSIGSVTRIVKEKDEINIDNFPLTFQVMTIPGHTVDHVAYYTPGILLCGDTLFAGGCGRIFEGTAEEMYASLQKMLKLPDDTLIYCAHEYTESNLNFAKRVEPENADIIQRITKIKALRKNNQPSLPSSLYEEKRTNPFLRCNIPEIKKQVEKFAGHDLAHSVEVFTWLRKWKGW